MLNEIHVEGVIAASWHDGDAEFLYWLPPAAGFIQGSRFSRGARQAPSLGGGSGPGLCGASSLTAVSQWGRDHSRQVLAQLGFTHFPGPSTATLCRVFSKIDAAVLERALAEWWQAWLPGLGPLALDGKTVRGSRQGSQEALQLLAAFATQVRVVLAQCAVSNGDEISTALALLEGLDLTG